MTQEHDYDLQKKVKIVFKELDYYVMPRYQEHYLNNEYERFSLQILKNNLDEDAVFVDIGAHYGAYSLYAAHAARSRVIAVEPVAENFKLLNENIRINKLTNLITAYEYAASDSNGEAEFNIPWASDSAGFYSHPNAHTIRTQKVVTRKMDDVINPKRADVIKIDTEGHEISVLKGLKDVLKHNPAAQLIIELNPPLLESAGTTAMALLKTIKDLDKEIYMVDEDKFTLYRITDCLEAWPRFINTGNYANLYCVPTENHQYIVFISHSAQLGGAEMAMLEQICELRNTGFMSHVILPHRGPLEGRLIEKGIGYSVVEEYSFWVKSQTDIQQATTSQEQNLKNIKASVEIAKLIEDLNPTMVVNNSVVNPWGYVAAQSRGLPLVWMIHEYGDLDHGLPFIRDVRATREFIVATSDLVICCSQAVKKELLGDKKDVDGKVHTVYNLMRPATIRRLSQESRKSPFSSGKVLKLCTVGTLSEGKGQIYIIEAMSVLRQQGIATELIIIGTANDYQAVLRKRATELDLEQNVKFLGFAANPYPFIKFSDAVVVASKNEAFGRVAAEAMMLEVPVIASNRGGSLEMIEDGVTGFLFTSMNIASLTSTIVRLQNMPLKNLRQLTKAACNKIETLLDAHKNTQKLAELVNRISLSPTTSESKKIMMAELVDAFQIYEQRLLRTTDALQQAKSQAAEQQQINIELLAAITDIQNSQSYKWGRMLSKVKHAARRIKE